MEIAKTNIHPKLIADSAGYNSEGNDMPGHLHTSQMGNFVTADMRRGFYCAAPIVYVEGTYYCTDPSQRVMSQLHISQSDIEMVTGKGK